MTQNLWEAAKALLRGKFIAIQSYLKKHEKSQIGNLTLHLMQCGLLQRWSEDLAVMHGIVFCLYFTLRVLQFLEVKSLSCVRLFATPWTVAYQASLSMGFSRQEYWSGLPFPSPGDLPDPGIKPRSPTLQEDTLPCEPLGKLKQNKKGYPKYWMHIFFCQTGS